MNKVEVFLQGEGVKDVVIVRVPKDGSVRDLSWSGSERGGQCAETRRSSSDLPRAPALPLQGWDAKWRSSPTDEACR